MRETDAMNSSPARTIPIVAAPASEAGACHGDRQTLQAAARAAGQQRWRAWREQGVTPVHHAFS